MSSIKSTAEQTSYATIPQMLNHNLSFNSNSPLLYIKADFDNKEQSSETDFRHANTISLSIGPRQLSGNDTYMGDSNNEISSKIVKNKSVFEVASSFSKPYLNSMPPTSNVVAPIYSLAKVQSSALTKAQLCNASATTHGSAMSFSRLNVINSSMSQTTNSVEANHIGLLRPVDQSKNTDYLLNKGYVCSGVRNSFYDVANHDELSLELIPFESPSDPTLKNDSNLLLSPKLKKEQQEIESNKFGELSFLKRSWSNDEKKTISTCLQSEIKLAYETSHVPDVTTRVPNASSVIKSVNSSPVCLTNEVVASTSFSSIRPGQSLLRRNVFNSSLLLTRPFLHQNDLVASTDFSKRMVVYDMDKTSCNSFHALASNSHSAVSVQKHAQMAGDNLKPVKEFCNRNTSYQRLLDRESSPGSENIEPKRSSNVNAIEKTMKMKHLEERNDGNSNNGLQILDDPMLSNQNINISDEVTQDLERLKELFVDNKCLICGFVSKRSRPRGGWCHMIVHMTVKPHQCRKCDKAFATLDRLRQHDLCHNDPDNDGPFSCSTCGKSFKRRSYLKNHEIRHEKIIRHRCEICQKGFARMMSLRRHARSHTGEKPFKCEICGRCFASSNSFKKHTNTHTKEKTFHCTVCDKTFYSAHYFSVHMKAHEHGTVFQCDVCDARFKFKSNLAQHKLTHSDARSHECEECGKLFKFPHHLRQHLDTHNRTNLSKRYNQKQKLKRATHDISNVTDDLNKWSANESELPNVDDKTVINISEICKMDI